MMAVILEPRTDARVIGKVSVRSTLFVALLFLAIVWCIFLTVFIDKYRNEKGDYDYKYAYTHWDIKPENFRYSFCKSGLICDISYQPTQPIAYSIQDLHAKRKEYYWVDFGEMGTDFFHAKPDYEMISVCYFNSNRDAEFAAAQFSPSGTRFYSRTGFCTREVIEISPNPSRKIWQHKNILIFYEGTDEAIPSALTEAYGTPVADGQQPDPPDTKQTFGETVRLIFWWKGWPVVLTLAVLGAATLVCFYFLIFPPHRNQVSPEKFYQLMKTKGVPVLKAEQAAADPYGGLPGVKSVCAYVPDSVSGRRILSKLSCHAVNGNRDEVEGLIFVFFFPSEKKARAARAMLSDTGERLQKPDGSMVRLGFSQDRMVISSKNMILYYNGKEPSLRTALTDLQNQK